jgi:hypothetical protein
MTGLISAHQAISLKFQITYPHSYLACDFEEKKMPSLLTISKSELIFVINEQNRTK